MRRGLGRGPRSLDGAGRLFSLIECYQSVAARNISAPLLSRVRAADLCPRGAAPFARAAWHQQATTGCPAAFIRRTARMAARRRRFQFYIERVQSVRRLFLQLRNFATLSFLRLACRSSARSAAPVYHILWVRGFRAHTISGRGFNLFNPLRRHFRATPLYRRALSRRDPGDRNASVQKIEDRLDDLRRDGGNRTNIERIRHYGKKFVSGLGVTQLCQSRFLKSSKETFLRRDQIDFFDFY